MSETDRKYKFDWSVIDSNMAEARPSLGDKTTVGVYRLLQFTMRDILEQRYGTEMADTLFRDAGTLAGAEFFKKFCTEASSLQDLTRIVQEKFRELGIGIVRFEVSDPSTNTFQLTVDEDLDCSGLPDTNDQICVYDEGFIKGILDSFTGHDFSVNEVDCWCSAARTCRFKATL